MNQCPIPTDHNLVHTHFAPSGLSHIRKGRWTWPLSLLSDKTLTKAIEEWGIKLHKEIDFRNTSEKRTKSENPQTLWEFFKTYINEIVKKTVKFHLAKTNQKIKNLQNDIQSTSNAPNIDTTLERHQNRIILEKELEHLEWKRYQNTHHKAQGQWSLKEETISKYWSMVNKSKKPRDITYWLKIPQTNNFTHKSEEMVEIANTYYENFQKAQSFLEEMRPERIQASLNEIPNKN
jgi:hypothetical protein